MTKLEEVGLAVQALFAKRYADDQIPDVVDWSPSLLDAIGRAAIKAIRVPSKEMAEASEPVLDRALEVAELQVSWTVSHAGPDVWRAMIDAALEEKA